MGPPWLQLALVALQLLAAVAGGAQAVPAPPPLLDAAYLAQRGAQADIARAALNQALARARAQATIARRQRVRRVWPTGAPPQGWPSAYKDLSALPAGGPRRTSVDAQGNITLQTLAPAADPPLSSFPRMPTPWLPPPLQMVFSCPTQYSVQVFGARGDGAADDAAPIQLAAAAGLPYLYFPPGTYRIASSLSLAKQIVVGANASLSIDAGATLTLTKRPQKWDIDNPLFTGKGSVVLAGEVDAVSPDWFRRDEENPDSGSWQRVIDSCGGACIIMSTRPYFFTQAVFLNPRTGVFSTDAGNINGGRGHGRGLVLTPGTYTLPLALSHIWAFDDFCFKVQGGVDGVELQMQGFLVSRDGLVFAPGEGTGSLIRRVLVTHLTATGRTQNSVVLAATTRTQRLRGCLVRCNFVTTPGAVHPAERSTALLVRGVPPRLVGTEVVFQAIDLAQFLPDANFKATFLENMASGPALNVFFRVVTWGGGVEQQGRVLDGAFRRLRFLSRFAADPVIPNFMPGLRGPQNLVTPWNLQSASFWCWMTQVPKLETYSCYNPYGPQLNGQPTAAQNIFANAPIVPTNASATWLPGEVRTYYLYNAYAAVFGSPRVYHMPNRYENNGVVVVGVENQHAQEPYRIAVKLKNAAWKDLPKTQGKVWLTTWYQFQIGP